MTQECPSGAFPEASGRDRNLSPGGLVRRPPTRVSPWVALLTGVTNPHTDLTMQS